MANNVFINSIHYEPNTESRIKSWPSFEIDHCSALPHYVQRKRNLLTISHGCYCLGFFSWSAFQIIKNSTTHVLRPTWSNIAWHQLGGAGVGGGASFVLPFLLLSSWFLDAEVQSWDFISSIFSNKIFWTTIYNWNIWIIT